MKVMMVLASVLGCRRNCNSEENSTVICLWSGVTTVVYEKVDVSVYLADIAEGTEAWRYGGSVKWDGEFSEFSEFFEYLLNASGTYSERDCFCGGEYPSYPDLSAQGRADINLSINTAVMVTEDDDVSRDLEGGFENVFTLKAGVKNVTNDFQEDLDQGLQRDAGYVYGSAIPGMITFELEIGV